jgi:ribose transport system substrate-binding protein
MIANSRLRGAVASAAALAALTALAACSASATSANDANALGGSSKGTPAWCGTKPIVFGMADGGGLNAWSKASAQSVLDIVHQCPNVTKVLTSDAGFSLQTAITGLQGIVAQGAKAIVIIPDAGGPGTQLAGIRAATQRGVAVVPWGSNPGGTPGEDYVTYVDGDHQLAGEAWASWIARHLPDGGQVAFFSGPPGNGPGEQELAGITSVFKHYPKIQLVTGATQWAVSNWDPATGQQAMAALLSKYPGIRAVISDEGVTTTGILRAFTAAGKPLPLVASLEANALGCFYQSYHAKDPGFAVATVGAMNVAGRVAAQIAIAKAAGVSISPADALSPKPILPDPILEDSFAGPAPACDPSQPASALLSNNMSDAQLRLLTNSGSYPPGVMK